jgi:hypothetical protein
MSSGIGGIRGPETTNQAQEVQSSKPTSFAGKLARLALAIPRGIGNLLARIGGAIKKGLSEFTARLSGSGGTGRAAQVNDGVPGTVRRLTSQAGKLPQDQQQQAEDKLNGLLRNGGIPKNLALSIDNGEVKLTSSSSKQLGGSEDLALFKDILASKIGNHHEKAVGSKVGDQSGPEFNFSNQFKIDINRDTYTLIGSDGSSQSLHSKSAENTDYQEVEQQWQKFCGDDPEVAFNLSRVMTQSMGNSLLDLMEMKCGVEMEGGKGSSIRDGNTPERKSSSVKVLENGNFQISITRNINVGLVTDGTGAFMCDPEHSTNHQSVTIEIPRSALKGSPTAQEMLSQITFATPPREDIELTST